MQHALDPPPADDDAPELIWYDLLSEMDALTRYLLTVAAAPFAPIIILDGSELDSRSGYRRWGPADRRTPDRARPDRRVRGRRREDRLPAYALC